MVSLVKTNVIAINEAAQRELDRQKCMANHPSNWKKNKTK